MERSAWKAEEDDHGLAENRAEARAIEEHQERKHADRSQVVEEALKAVGHWIVSNGLRPPDPAVDPHDENCPGCIVEKLARQLEEVEAERDRYREEVEAERDRYREAIDQHLKWCSSPDVLSEALHPQEGAESGDL
jgi:vacuolar-type H+-ATPase subunit I/STV1